MQKDATSTTPVENNEIFRLGKWLLIEKKTDILAFAAFVLSVIGLFNPIKDALKGPKVSFIPPPAITFGSVPNQRKEGTNSFRYTTNAANIHVVVDMAYINDGSVGYGDAVTREWVTLTCSSNVYRLLAHRFVVVTRREAFRDDLAVNVLSSAVPVGVEGGATVTHSSYFAPVRSSFSSTQVLSVATFIRHLEEQEKTKPSANIPVSIEFELHSGNKITKHFNCFISADGLQDFRQTGWINGELTPKKCGGK